jgi:hypothetical protein
LFYQDRLGTNIGKTQKKPVLLQLFDRLLTLKLEEQRRQELIDTSTTAAKRWVNQTYEVDDSVRT